MRIGIDASRANIQERTGVENYAFFVTNELKKSIPREHEVTMYSREKLNGSLAVLPPHWRSRVLRMPLRRLWTQVRLSWEMLFRAPDVLFVPAHVMPRIHPHKTVVVIHDVAPMRFPESYSWFERWYAGVATRFALARAWKIIVPSQFTKNELISLFGVSQERAETIFVVPLGYDMARFHNNLRQEQIDETLNNLGIRRPYVLYVGRLEEKKDVATLVQAYDAMRAQTHAPCQLILVGKPGYGYEQVRRAIDGSPYTSDIRELGYVDASALTALYGEAEVLSYATKYEGFGIPVLEASACGTPVIIREGNATEEITNETALMVDGTAQSLTNALVFVLTDQEWKARRERAHVLAPETQKYTWTRTAQKISEIIGVGSL